MSVRCHGGGFSLVCIEERPGFVLAKLSGPGAFELFAGESGGHRWQRVPPNDKRGRVHTSTITVAVLPELGEHELQIDPRDVEESFTGSGGPGGQHQNKRATAVVLHHIPSDIRVRIEGRSRHRNRQQAMEILRARLGALQQATRNTEQVAARRRLIGSGARGDKIRTVSVRNDLVIDHASGKRTTYRRYQRGYL
jgi:peptide chain release factor 1